jgi:membrane protease YdiL (CAAX protease family)
MLPEKTWKTESVLRLLLAVFGTLCVGVVLAGAVMKLNPNWSDATTRMVSMMIVTLSFHGAAFFWIQNFLKIENISWRDAFGFDSQNRRRAIGLGIVAAIIVLPVAWALQQLTAWLMTSSSLHPEPQELVQEIQKSGVPQLQQIYLAVVAVILAPIVEEMLFRGIIYPTIKRAGYPRAALWGTSILFSLTHQNIPAFFALVFFAIILTLLYEETGNLIAPMVAHSCFNLANFVLLLLAKHFSWLST